MDDAAKASSATSAGSVPLPLSQEQEGNQEQEQEWKWEQVQERELEREQVLQHEEEQKQEHHQLHKKLVPSMSPPPVFSQRPHSNGRLVRIMTSELGQRAASAAVVAAIISLVTLLVLLWTIVVVKRLPSPSPTLPSFSGTTEGNFRVPYSQESTLLPRGNETDSKEEKYTLTLDTPKKIEYDSSDSIFSHHTSQKNESKIAQCVPEVKSFWKNMQQEFWKQLYKCERKCSSSRKC